MPSDCLLLGAVYKFAYLLTYLLTAMANGEGNVLSGRSKYRRTSQDSTGHHRTAKDTTGQPEESNRSVSIDKSDDAKESVAGLIPSP